MEKDQSGEDKMARGRNGKGRNGKIPIVTLLPSFIGGYGLQME